MVPCSAVTFHLIHVIEPLYEKSGPQSFPTRSDTNWAVKTQKIAKGLKILILVLE